MFGALNLPLLFRHLAHGPITDDDVENAVRICGVGIALAVLIAISVAKVLRRPWRGFAVTVCVGLAVAFAIVAGFLVLSGL